MTTELDALDPVSETFTLSSGTVVRLERMRTRQLLKLLKIITTGGASLMSQMDFDYKDSGQFVGQLVGLVMFSIPEAENEAIEFIQAMVIPAALSGGDTKQERLRDQETWFALRRELDNPPLEDLLNIIERIVKTEGPDIQGLGKRLGSMLEIARRASSPSGDPQTSTQMAS